jgi:glycosyltransferase involved in cell wall biosynthesis
MTQHDNDTRPGLAIVTNSVTPYHVNLQRLVAAGIPELKLHVLITHFAADFKWNVEIPLELHLQRFGAVGEHPLENPLKRPVWGWRKGGRMIRYFRENNIRAAIINGYRFISYLRLMNYCYRSNIPFFVNADSNIRSEPVLSPVSKFSKRAIYNWWMKRGSGVFSMGTLGDEFFIKYGARPDRLYRVPYWPELSAFERVDPAGLQRFRQSYRLDPQRRLLLFSGRLVSAKRVDLLIDAFAAIASARPNWDLLIVGDGVLNGELHGRVPEPLRSRVIWTGFLEAQELASAYHAADVLVLPSDHEPWAVVVHEALAAGLVVVASSVVGAAHDMVEDGKSGRIFPAGDVQALTQALLDVTAENAFSNFKEQSRNSLIRWTTAVRPVEEIRRALRDAGILTAGSKIEKETPPLSVSHAAS